MTTITHIKKAFSNSPSCIPYALGVLDCGHCIEVFEMQRNLQCSSCGHDFWESVNAPGRCTQCDGGCFKILASTDAHDEAAHFRHVGDEVYCKSCNNADRGLEALRAAVEAGEIHHTRQKSWGGVSQIHAYRLDPKSPSHFMLVCTVEETSKVREYFKSLGRSGLTPLSPTERA